MMKGGIYSRYDRKAADSAVHLREQAISDTRPCLKNDNIPSVNKGKHGFADRGHAPGIVFIKKQYERRFCAAYQFFQF